MTLDHDSNDPLVSARNLAGDFVADLDLARVVLLAVGVAQIDHDSLGQACCSQFLASCADARRVVVGLSSAAKDDVTVFIAERRYDRRVAGLGHG